MLLGKELKKDENDQVDKTQGNIKSQKKAKKDNKKIEVTFDLKQDIKQPKSDQKKLIQIDKDDQVLRNLFITPQEEDEALEEFEKEKDRQIESDLGTKVQVPVVKRGWNEWAGEGVSEKGFDNRLERESMKLKERRQMSLRSKDKITK